MKQLYLPTGVNDQFSPSDFGTFSDYASHYRQIVQQGRKQSGFFANTQLIDAVSPFEWVHPSASYGILMLHGLLESPFLIRDIAHYFYQQKYSVRGLLLPGHATAPGDLLNTSAKSWQQCCDFGIQSMVNDQQLKGFYLLGVSTGGALSLLAAYQQKIEKLKGIILFSPAIRVRHYRHVYSQISGVLSLFCSRAKWIYKGEEKDFARYCSLPFYAADQVYRLTKKIAQQSHKDLSYPLFMTVSTEDAVVSCSHNINYFKQQRHPDSRMIVYSSKPRHDEDLRVRFINSTHPKEHILHYPHIALHVSPNNVHYGRQGDYEIMIKKNRQQKFYGEVTRQGVTHRLSYNPDFDNLMSQIKAFVEKTC